jgi:hypothetical protein
MRLLIATLPPPTLALAATGFDGTWKRNIDAVPLVATGWLKRSVFAFQRYPDSLLRHRTVSFLRRPRHGTVIYVKFATGGFGASRSGAAVMQINRDDPGFQDQAKKRRRRQGRRQQCRSLRSPMDARSVDVGVSQ